MNKIKLISLLLPYYKDSKHHHFWFQVRESTDNLNGLLEIPGGKIEMNETPLEAAKREFHEEVGINVSGERINLLKIHDHTKVDNFVFYIFAMNVERYLLPEEGWIKVEKENLDFLKEKIPSENLLFLKDILKTL